MSQDVRSGRKTVTFGRDAVASAADGAGDSNSASQTLLYILQKTAGSIIKDALYGKLVARQATAPDGATPANFSVDAEVRALLAANGIKARDDQTDAITLMYEYTTKTVAELLAIPDFKQGNITLSRVIAFLIRIAYPSYQYTCKSAGPKNIGPLLALLKSKETVQRFEKLVRAAHGSGCAFL